VTREHGPEFNLEPLRALQAATGDGLSGEGPAAESRIGFAVAGVPHLVVRVETWTRWRSTRAPRLSAAVQLGGRTGRT
jgi:hypothetical protein